MSRWAWLECAICGTRYRAMTPDPEPHCYGLLPRDLPPSEWDPKPLNAGCTRPVPPLSRQGELFSVHLSLGGQLELVALEPYRELAQALERVGFGGRRSQ